MKKYDAFISYRHTEPDNAIAEKLHKMLETFKVPASIAKKLGRKKLSRVFRDRDELPTSSNLASSIEEALINSEYLIVICSPRTPKSQWVTKEIETFSKLKGHDKILALLIEGEPEESFPKELCFIPKKITKEDGTIIEELIKVEPLAADIRGKDIKEMVKNLNTELLRLLSPILGCSFDDLKQRHKERFIKKVVTASVTLSLFFIAFGSFSTWQAIKFKQQVNKTLEGQSLYLSDLSNRILQEGDRRTSMLLALEALPKNLENPERPYVEEAEYALSEALKVYKTNYNFVSDIALNHRKGVSNIKISPDNTKVFTVCNDGYIYVWNTEDGSLLFSFSYNSNFLDPTHSTFFTPDSKSIISITSEGCSAWSMETGKEIWKIQGYFNTLELSPDKKTAILTSNNIKVIDILTGKELYSLSLTSKDDTYILSSKYNNDGTKIAVGTDKGSVFVFDTINKKQLYQLSCTYQKVDYVSFSNDDSKIAASSNFFTLENGYDKNNGNLEVWDVNTGNSIISMTVNNHAIESPIFNPTDSNTIIFIEDKTVQVLDTVTKEILYTFILGSQVSSMQILESGTYILIAANDGNIKFYSLENGAEFYSWDIHQSSPISMMDLGNGVMATSSTGSNKAYLWKTITSPNLTLLENNGSYISKGEFSPDGKKALSLRTSQPYIDLWDIENKILMKRLDKFNGAVQDAFFNSQGTKIISFSEDGYLKLWDISTFFELASIYVGESYNYTYNSSKTRLALQSEGKVKIIDTSSFKEISTISVTDFFIDQIVLPNSINSLLITDSSKTALYDIHTGKLLHTFNNLIGETGCFSRDDHLLALSAEDGIHIFELNTFKELAHIKTTNIHITSMEFDDDHGQLFVGLDDQTIQIYNTKTYERVAELSGHQSNFEKFMYRKQDNVLITIGESHDCLFWNATNFKKLAYINTLYDMDYSFKNILSSNSEGLLLMPHYSLKELKKEAKKQLGTRELTEKEKIKYYIIQ